MLKKHVKIIHKKRLDTFVQDVKAKLMNSGKKALSEQNTRAGCPLKTTPTHFDTNQVELEKNPNVNVKMSATDAVEDFGTVS